jgi:hypothetical protein
MGSIPSSDSRRPLPGGPSVTQAEPSWSVGSGVPRFLVPVTTSPGRAPCAVDRQIHCGSAPRVSHPLGGFLAYPGFAAFGPTSPWSPTCRCRSGPSPSRFHPQESRVPSGTAGSLVVRVGAALSADPSCPDLPGFLPTPASFRPTLTEAPGLLPCDLVCGRPRRSSRSWSRARATFHQSRSSGLLVTRRHVEPCSPSRRSVDLGAFFLPRARRPSPNTALANGYRLVGRDLRGVLPLQSFVPAAGLWP